MPLQKTALTITLGKGLETKSDPKQLSAGVLTILENGVFTSPGKLRKRPGSEVKARSIFDSASEIAAGYSFFTLGDQKLIHDGTHLYAWSESGDEWKNVSGGTGVGGLQGTLPAVTVEKKTITSYSWNLAHPDMAKHASGYTLTAWENPTADSGGGIYWTLYDESTETRLYSDQALPVVTSAFDQRSPKVICFGNYLVVIFINGQSIYFTTLDVTDVAGGMSNPVLVHANLPSTATQRHYDAVVQNGRIWIVGSSGTGTTIQVATVAADLTVTGNLISHTATATACLGLAPYQTLDGVEHRLLVMHASSTGLYFSTINTDSQAIGYGPVLVETITNVVSVGGHMQTDSDNVSIFYTVSPTNYVPTWKYRVRTRQIDATYNVWLTAASDFCRSVGLAGKPFKNGDIIYVPVLYSSLYQPTGFLLDHSGRPVAKWLSGAAGAQLVGASSLTGTSLLPGSNWNSTTKTATLAVQETVNGGSNLIDAISLNLSPKTQPRAVLADTLHFGSGITWMYDGASVVEHGFLLFPEAPILANPGGSFSYQYIVVYEWTDNQGRIHRSAPSVPATQAQNAAIDSVTNAVPVDIPTLRVTLKQNLGDTPYLRVKLVLYRTINNGSIFYRCLDVTQETPYNSTTIDSITVNDTTTDEQIQSHPTLYTTGGAVENFPSAPPLAMAQVKSRIWVLDSTNPYMLWFSKEVRPTFPVEFSAFYTMNLESEGGPAVAIANLDEKVVVLRDRKISYIAGFGPALNATELGYEEIGVPGDTGCVDPRSVVTSTPGVIYKSHKGFYLLDRSLQSQYIGAPVEQFNSYTCTSAVALPKTTWILFTMSNGSALLYDYLMDQWSTYQNVSAVDAGLWDNLYAFLSSDGYVHIETPGAFDDNGSYLPLRWRTGWMNLNGLAGFGRLWDIILTGEWKSPHRLTFEFAVDYDDTIVQTKTFDAPTSVKPYQWKVDLDRSHIQALQLTVTESAYDSTKGEGLDISGISMEIGVRPTLFKPTYTRKG